jgi:hypothetical protein
MDAISVPDQRLELLQSWLDQGWQIEQPVLQRRVLYAATGQACVFEVVIIKCGEWRVIALSDGPDVYAFLMHHHLDVICI